MINKLFAIFWKDLLGVISYRLGFFGQLIMPVFMIASFFFLSRLLEQASLPELERYGSDYFSFAIVGIVFTTFSGLFLNTLAATIRQGQTMGTLEQVLTTQTSLGTYLVGSSFYSILWGTTVSVGFWALGVLVFGADFHNANLVSSFLILVLSMIIMLGLGLFSGSFVLVYKQGDPLNLLVSSGSFLLSGVIYPVAVLPNWLQIGSWMLPHTYALEGLRMALLQGATVSQVAPQLGALMVFAAVIFSVSILFFKYAVRRVRVEGSLAQY